MVSHHKNLLEAFRAAAHEDQDAERQKPASAVSGGGPFATPKPGVPAGTNPFAARLAFGTHRPRPFLQRALGDRTIQLVLLGGAIVLAAVFYLGGERGGTGGPEGAGTGVQAAGTAGAGSFARPGGREGTADALRENQLGAQLGTPDDQAFHDLANRYTVRVAQYKHDERGLELALSTVAWLRKEGYPAVRPIRTGDGQALIVCAGAKPGVKDLDTLAEFVQGLRGPPPQPKKPPFRDAYVVPIDDVLKRR